MKLEFPKTVRYPWKKILLAILLALLVYLCNAACAQDNIDQMISSARALREKLLADPYRPGYHFVIPAEGRAWTFDVNGAIYWKGRYHLFYIRPSKKGHCWGHASSIDLVHWRHHPTPLVPEPNGPDRGMYSGCAFLNKEGVPTIVYHGAKASMCIATSTNDDLETWTQSPHNPVIPEARKEADPGYGKYSVFDPVAWIHNGRYYAALGNLKFPKELRDSLKPEERRTWSTVYPAGKLRPAGLIGPVKRIGGIACKDMSIISPQTGQPEVIYVNGRDLQKVIDDAPPHSTVICDANKRITLERPVVINKALTLSSINAQLPYGLGKTPLLIVEANGVTIRDFELYGNVDSVPQIDRAPLLLIRAGNFTVEKGLFVNSTKDGVTINATEKMDTVGGVIRDIVGRGNGRDVVSISGGKKGPRVRNVLVENVRCYRSRGKGGVEVSDGTDNITVRKVYTEDSTYAVDVQDHGREQVNSNVLVEDIYALNCKHAVRTDNRQRGHSNLTVRDVTARQCGEPLKISNTKHVIIENVRVIEHKHDVAPIRITNCDGLSIENVTVVDSDCEEAVILLENCDSVVVNGLTLRGRISKASIGVKYIITSGEAFSDLRISNVAAPRVKKAGILLAKGDKGGTLTDYSICGNIANVIDNIKGERSFILNNVSYDMRQSEADEQAR